MHIHWSICKFSSPAWTVQMADHHPCRVISQVAFSHSSFLPIDPSLYITRPPLTFLACSVSSSIPAAGWKSAASELRGAALASAAAFFPGDSALYRALGRRGRRESQQKAEPC